MNLLDCGLGHFFMGILWIRIPIEIRSIQTIPSPNQQSACPQDTLPHTKPKTQGATAQPRIPFIRKSPDLKHQENFSKGTPHDKISVQHPARGLSGDGRRPLTVFLRHPGEKSPGQKAKNKKSRNKYLPNFIKSFVDQKYNSC